MKKFLCLIAFLVVRDHTFYNIGTLNYEGVPRMVSVGVFNHVFTISEEDAKQLMKDRLKPQINIDDILGR